MMDARLTAPVCRLLYIIHPAGELTTRTGVGARRGYLAFYAAAICVKLTPILFATTRPPSKGRYALYVPSGSVHGPHV